MIKFFLNIFLIFLIILFINNFIYSFKLLSISISNNFFSNNVKYNKNIESIINNNQSNYRNEKKDVYKNINKVTQLEKINIINPNKNDKKEKKLRKKQFFDTSKIYRNNKGDIIRFKDVEGVQAIIDEEIITNKNYSNYKIRKPNLISNCVNNENVKNENAILVRAFEPTKSQILRYKEWKESFAKYNFDTWFLIHDEDDRKGFEEENVIYCKFQEVLDNYPLITELRKPGHCLEKNQSDSSFYMWISHTESIVLWYKRVGCKYKYVWILEQDVAYTGDLGSFLESFNNVNSDFISYDIRPDYNISFLHLRCATDKYIQRQKNIQDILQDGKDLVLTTREFIQRWSKKLFTVLSDDLDNGYNAISEMSVAETVIYNNLTYSFLPSSSIGIYWSWYPNLPKYRFNAYFKRKEYMNKLYHPVKF